MLALMLGAVLLSRSVGMLAAGTAAGVAAAMVPRALLAAPFLLLPVSAQPGSILPLLIGLAVGWTVLVLPLVAAGVSALAASLMPAARLEPGVGLANLLLDLGEDGATAGMGLAIVTAALAAVGAIVALRSGREFPRLYALAGMLLLAGLFTSPAGSPHDLAAPIVFLLLGVVGASDRARR